MKELKRIATVMTLAVAWNEVENIGEHDGLSIEERKVYLVEKHGYKKSSIQELFATMDRRAIELLYDVNVENYATRHSVLCAATYLKKEGDKITFKVSTQDKKAFYDVYAYEYAEINVRISWYGFGDGTHSIETAKSYRHVYPFTIAGYTKVYRKGNKFIVFQA